MSKAKSKSIAANRMPVSRTGKAVAALRKSVGARPAKASKGVASTSHQPLRALIEFASLSAGHRTFLIRESGSAPHLKIGEYAVIDQLDRELQHGEVYLIQGTSGERRRRLAQATSSYCNITGPGAEETLVWWLKDLRGMHDTGQRLDGIPLFAGLSDGPYRAEDLQRQIAGRVVGFAHKSFGKVIAPSAGFHDEAGGNAAFDPAEYLDVLIATGHEPYICGGAYFESPPERALSDAERKQVLAVHSKFAEASTALGRVKQECIRRGLVKNSRAA
jgi:hypothetical protein